MSCLTCCWSRLSKHESFTTECDLSVIVRKRRNTVSAASFFPCGLARNTGRHDGTLRLAATNLMPSSSRRLRAEVPVERSLMRGRKCTSSGSPCIIDRNKATTLSRLGCFLLSLTGLGQVAASSWMKIGVAGLSFG